MMPAQLAIARFNRDLVVAFILNTLLFLGVVFSILFGGAVNSHLGDVALLVILGAIWIALGFHSIRGSRIAAGSPSLIAAGQFDQAEEQIETALRSFSLFRGSKMMSLHHLAVLRHAQRRWGDAADLCRALLRHRLGVLSGLARQSRLILADSLLELGDVRGAHEALSALYRDRLSLAEALSLLSVQLDYLWRIHAWDAMFDGVAQKVQLAELSNTHSAAKMQALLALAARHLGRTDWEDYLRRRVELLVDVDELIKERPVLHELYRATPPGNETDGSAQPPSQPGQV